MREGILSASLGVVLISIPFCCVYTRQLNLFMYCTCVPGKAHFVFFSSPVVTPLCGGENTQRTRAPVSSVLCARRVLCTRAWSAGLTLRMVACRSRTTHTDRVEVCDISQILFSFHL